jgi:hypothetical protein
MDMEECRNPVVLEKTRILGFPERTEHPMKNRGKSAMKRSFRMDRELSWKSMKLGVFDYGQDKILTEGKGQMAS